MVLEPSFFVTKDNHLLRWFYVKQKFFIFPLKFESVYKFNENMEFFINYKYLKKDKTPMNYYNDYGKYLTINSSFTSRELTIGIGYTF